MPCLTGWVYDSGEFEGIQATCYSLPSTWGRASWRSVGGDWQSNKSSAGDLTDLNIRTFSHIVGIWSKIGTRPSHHSKRYIQETTSISENEPVLCRHGRKPGIFLHKPLAVQKLACELWSHALPMILLALPSRLWGILQIEMYADPTARGGVLEPEGMVEIKFRSSDFIAAMHRLDKTIISLKQSKMPHTDKAIKKREAELLPVYRQASWNSTANLLRPSNTFLHDTLMAQLQLNVPCTFMPTSAAISMSPIPAHERCVVRQHAVARHTCHLNVQELLLYSYC